MKKDIQDSLHILQANVKVANQMLDTAKQSLDVSFKSLMESSEPSDLKGIQNYIGDISEMFYMAKKGNNVDNQINAISKRLKNERFNNR